MKFRCLPYLGYSVVLIPAKTVFHGPGHIENVTGVELQFTNGYLDIDENVPGNLEKIKLLMKHPAWNNPVQFVQQTVPIEVDGRKGFVQGPSLEEAIAAAEGSVVASPAGPVLGDQLQYSIPIEGGDVPAATPVMDGPMNSIAGRDIRGRYRKNSAGEAVPAGG